MKSGWKWGICGMLLGAAGVLFSQNPAIQRTIVHREDVSVAGRQAVIARVELAPQGKAGRHTHPGDEISSVLGCEGESLVEGKPARKVKGGHGYVSPAGAKHEAHQIGSTQRRLDGGEVI